MNYTLFIKQPALVHNNLIHKSKHNTEEEARSELVKISTNITHPHGNFHAWIDGPSGCEYETDYKVDL